MYGFVNLIKLFCAIDTAFLTIWKGRFSDNVCSNTWLDHIQRKLDTSTSDITESVESQKLDILISQQWLHLLTWQLAVKSGMLSSSSSGRIKELQYPVQVARDVVQITSTVSQQSLDSHGIGMASLSSAYLRSCPGISANSLWCCTGTEDRRYCQWSHGCSRMCGVRLIGAI
jgi:hypothetical protein